MKYIINYTNEGKIIGFAKGDTYLNIEVSNAIWFENQGMNKIIIDGENISFDKVNWRAPEEIQEQELQQQIAEALKYLSDTDHKFYNVYKPKEGEDLVAIELSRDTAREFIRANKGVI